MMTFNRGIGYMWYCGGFIGQHIFYHTQKQKQKIHARAAFQIQMSITTDLVDVFLQDPFLYFGLQLSWESTRLIIVKSMVQIHLSRPFGSLVKWLTQGAATA